MNKNTTRFILALILIALGAFFIFRASDDGNEVPQDDPVDTSGWETFESEEYAFSLEYPSDWNMEVDTSFEFSPKFNFYIKPQGVPVDLPLTHFSNVTQVSVFPLGIPTEGLFGESQEVHFATGKELRDDSSRTFVLEDETPFASFIRFAERPSAWNESGFIFARVRIEDLETQCMRDGDVITEEECDPLVMEDTIVRNGDIDESMWPTIEKIVRSIEFSDRGTADLIKLETPEAGEEITSPLTIHGEARGTWFFEATFPIVLTDWDGRIIAEGYAEAQDEWMTEEFVPFEGVLEFERPSYGDRGSLILQKANPSGLPENDDALEIQVMFE